MLNVKLLYNDSRRRSGGGGEVEREEGEEQEEEKKMDFFFQLTEYPCNNTYDIFFLIHHGYF